MNKKRITFIIVFLGITILLFLLLKGKNIHKESLERDNKLNTVEMQDSPEKEKREINDSKNQKSTAQQIEQPQTDVQGDKSTDKNDTLSSGEGNIETETDEDGNVIFKYSEPAADKKNNGEEKSEISNNDTEKSNSIENNPENFLKKEKEQEDGIELPVIPVE